MIRDIVLGILAMAAEKKAFELQHWASGAPTDEDAQRLQTGESVCWDARDWCILAMGLP